MRAYFSTAATKAAAAPPAASSPLIRFSTPKEPRVTITRSIVPCDRVQAEMSPGDTSRPNRKLRPAASAPATLSDITNRISFGPVPGTGALIRSPFRLTIRAASHPCPPCARHVIVPYGVFKKKIPVVPPNTATHRHSSSHACPIPRSGDAIASIHTAALRSTISSHLPEHSAPPAAARIAITAALFVSASRFASSIRRKHCARHAFAKTAATCAH